MTHARRFRALNITREQRLDLYDYAHPRTRRPRRRARHDAASWTVTDDWPEEVPVTEAEIEVFETWFGDLFEKLFSTRH
jgi:hypothetical protein